MTYNIFKKIFYSIDRFFRNICSEIKIHKLRPDPSPMFSSINTYSANFEYDCSEISNLEDSIGSEHSIYKLDDNNSIHIEDSFSVDPYNDKLNTTAMSVDTFYNKKRLQENLLRKRLYDDL